MNQYDNSSARETLMGFTDATEIRTGAKMLDRELYPFKSNYLNINGLRYHYLDEGEGEPIVMVHGNPTWSFYYRNLIKALRPHYRVIVPDHIGMGLSDKPGDNRYHYTAVRRMEDLGKLIDHLKLKKFTLVGHDWGGIIGTAYASLNPDKIRAMVMMNTAGFIWPVAKRLPFALFLSRIPIGSALFIRGLNAFARGAIILGMNRHWMPYNVAKGLLFPYGSWKDRIAVHRFIQDIPVRPTDPGYEMGLLMESRLKLLRDVPKLLCWGMKDFIFDDKFLNEWVRHFPDAEVHQFDDAGHYVLEDAAEDVIPLVERFLKERVYPAVPARKKEHAAPAKKQEEFRDLAEHLLDIVRKKPDGLVVAHQKKLKLNGRGVYDTRTYSVVDRESNQIAHGLEKVGITRGMHTVLMVTPGTDFFAVLSGILKIGAIPVLVDPGMGIRNLKKCMAEAEPEAFIGIPKAHLARVLLRWAKKSVRINVTVGRRYCWGGWTLGKIESLGSAEPYIMTVKPKPEDTAMLAFTSGNTGIPKGVIFTHGIMSAQLDIIGGFIEVKEGDADLSTFPPFALFGPACGVPAIIPDMDATKPASANPRKLVAAINDYQCTSTFCSPALVEKIGRYCEAKGIKLPSLRKVLSAGAPARMSSLERFLRLLSPGVEIVTPYGATEALPVTYIGTDELMKETKKLTEQGSGVCVGRPVPGVEVAIVPISEEAIEEWTDTLRLPAGTIGEIAAKGPVVTTVYYKRPVQTRLAKIKDPRDGGIWHRMGDVGYLDKQGRLWMCGRKVHRVVTQNGTLFSLPCEAIFNNHPKVNRSALVGIVKNGRTEPVIIIELEKGLRLGPRAKKQLTVELLNLGEKHNHTKTIKTVLYRRNFPVDIRHNAKILREKLAVWAQREV
ncbi:MAG: alpha/beta fold hydrolase [Spirochaetes bacterium]|nr:alpha/beta fold hydrolase [Spirochaetota bacterium]